MPSNLIDLVLLIPLTAAILTGFWVLWFGLSNLRRSWKYREYLYGFIDFWTVWAGAMVIAVTVGMGFELWRGVWP